MARTAPDGQRPFVPSGARPPSVNVGGSGCVSEPRRFRRNEQAKEQVDIIALARQSDDFRRVVITGDKIQIVVMTIQPGEEIGAETHEGHDQVLFFVDCEGEAVLDGDRSTVRAGDLSFVHAGVHHNFINTGSEPLGYTAAAPGQNPPTTGPTSSSRCRQPHHDAALAA